MAVRKDWGDGLFATGYDVPNNSWEFADIPLQPEQMKVKRLGRIHMIIDYCLILHVCNMILKESIYFCNVGRDASSAFDKDYRVDYFKSVTGGWKISEESFLENVSFDFLKLRASYGTLGNLVGNDLYRATQVEKPLMFSITH